MSTRRQILRGSVVVGGLSLLGSATGILVDTAIAAKLGMSKGSDVFYVAFTLPYIITNLLSATGQFSLVPFFISEDAREASGQLSHRFSYAVSVVFLGLSAIAAAGAVAAPWLIRGIAPGLTSSQTTLAVELSRWLFFIIIPAGVGEVFRSFLLSRQSLALPSAGGFFRNLAVIVSIVLAFGRYGDLSIVLGYFAGYFLQIAVLGAKVVVSFPVRYSPALEGGGEAFRKLRGAGMAQVGAAMAWQGLVVVERIIASFLPAGTLTALNWGLKIMSTLGELLAGSVGTVALPGLSRAAALKEGIKQRKTFQIALEIGLTLVVPVTVFCLILNRNIIRLIFERGNFTPEATATMSSVFFYYSLSLVFFSAVRVLTFQLFARQEAQLFFRLTVFLYGLTVALDLFYVGVLRWGAKGIPLSLLTSLIVTLGLAGRRNVSELGQVLDRSFGLFAAKNLLGAGLAAAALAALRLWLAEPLTGLGNFLYLAVLCGLGSIVYLASLLASRTVPLSELRAAWQPSPEA